MSSSLTYCLGMVWFVACENCEKLALRQFVVMCVIVALTACSDSSSSGGGAGASPLSEDGSQSDNSGLFEIDQTVSDMGGVSPANTQITDASESSNYLAGLQFVDGKGIEIEFLHESKGVLDALDIKTGVVFDGFDPAMLVSDGFTSVVYPDDFTGDRLVELAASTESRLIVYWPEDKLYEVIPGSRNENNALEIVLPALYKQTFFALMKEGALSE